MYRVGFPGWKLAARMGVPLLYTVDVAHDPEVGVFIATSQDVPGLVVESEDMARLLPDVYDCMDMLMEQQLKVHPKKTPMAAWNGNFCTA